MVDNNEYKYRIFNRSVKHTLKEILVILPQISSQINFILTMVKLSKRIHYKMPYKYFKLLLGDPYMSHIEAKELKFFLSDEFTVQGYDDVVREIKEKIRDTSEDAEKNIWASVDRIIVARNLVASTDTND